MAFTNLALKIMLGHFYSILLIKALTKAPPASKDHVGSNFDGKNVKEFVNTFLKHHTSSERILSLPYIRNLLPLPNAAYFRIYPFIVSQ